MRTILAGNNKLACDVLNWLIEQKEEIVGVVSENKDLIKEKGGWEKPFFQKAKRISNKKNIPFYSGNINGIANVVEELNPEVICFCRYVALIKPEILNIPKKGCTNLHYGELPRYGGCAPITWAIKNGEDHIGVTMHYMSNKFDEGFIIDQRSIDITKKIRTLNLPDNIIIEVKGLTSFEVYQQANDLAFQMFKENYLIIKQNSERRNPMDLSQQRYYKKGELDFERDKYIDLKIVRDEEISRHVRAFTFPPIQMPIGKLNGKEIELKLK